ncbi:MAG: hypothetical protein Ct9H300mP11_27890 [Chloroflexota bacterium]|nr:MAG: hypothetical protein Ct9H300mP11_27890 [Chloroflexota bacterium]
MYSASLKGTCAVRFEYPVLVGFHVGLVKNKTDRIGQFGEEIGLWSVCGDCYRTVVDNLNTGQFCRLSNDPLFCTDDVTEENAGVKGFSFRCGSSFERAI